MSWSLAQRRAARSHRRSRTLLLASVGLAAGVAAGAAARMAGFLDPLVPMTLNDFHLPGTQVNEVTAPTIMESPDCAMCHGDFDSQNEPYASWRGSLMGLAGRDPLFFAQMATANQDVANVGYFCIRCHVPMAFTTGTAYDASGNTLNDTDKDGVTCHFCHSMVDPVYRPGVSPPEDLAILSSLQAGAPPAYYGNAMFVLDPLGTRRGPRADATPPHELLHSPFHLSGNMCGTCHDVGNVAVTQQANGTFRYNALDQPTPDQDLAHQFPLERTFTEWKLSAFASGGVDMGGRFNGTGSAVVSTCQDCHMPKVSARACFFGPVRPDLARHEFAGAAAQVLDLIGLFSQGNDSVDQAAVARGRERAVSMLERAATLTVSRDRQTVRVRVTNESGHKLPTGHIEGRRVWVNARFLDSAGNLLAERGAYDGATATLDGRATSVYEMHVGLSEDAAAVTGLPAGETTHMALADTIEKDSRIPPRGFSNQAYALAGAPAVAHAYADGQYWDEPVFPAPPGTARVAVTLYYQQTPREYIDHLRDANHSNQWGQTLHDLWTQTGRGAPIVMAGQTLELPGSCTADWNGDGLVSPVDVAVFVTDWFAAIQTGSFITDLDASGRNEPADIARFVSAWFGALGTGC